MNRSESPNKQNRNNYRKTVQNYTISYCQKQFLGRSLYGQVRLGFQVNDKKVKAFRINSLPMSEQAKANLNLQKNYSQISQCCRQIYSQIQSQSNRYTAMQYFPKTFKTQLTYFRKLTKNMQPYIQKFLQTYSKLYYYKIIHGNISIDNIGITFDGKVKLMDFRQLNQLSFQEASMKDYRDFRNMICFILQRDKIFPARFQVFDDPEGNWQKLFSVWHIVNIYQYVFRQKKQSYRNIVVLLSKLQSTIYLQIQQEPNNKNQQQQPNSCIIPEQNLTPLLRTALRLLILSNLKKIPKKNKQVLNQISQIQKLLSPIEEHDISFYNSLLWGSINDPKYYKLQSLQRLTLIFCLLPQINHQYFYMEIIKEFQPSSEQLSNFQIYADSLLKYYSGTMLKNLIQF